MIKNKLTCRSARLIRTDAGTSSFGGEAHHEGTHPNEWQQPLHLVATLDAQSPVFPLDNYPHASLPLYYPFASGSPRLQYRVNSDTEIEIIAVSRFQSLTQPMIESTFLPHFRADLVPFTYDEARAMALAEAYPAYDLDADDQALVDKTHAFSTVRTGVNLRTFQGDVFHQCLNPECQMQGEESGLSVFCITPCSRNLAPNPHWGNYPSSVDLVFGICPFCGTFVARNVST